MKYLYLQSAGLCRRINGTQQNVVIWICHEDIRKKGCCEKEQKNKYCVYTLQFKKTDRNIIYMVCYVSILRWTDNIYKVRLAVKIKEYISEKKIKTNLVLRLLIHICSTKVLQYPLNAFDDLTFCRTNSIS